MHYVFHLQIQQQENVIIVYEGFEHKHSIDLKTLVKIPQYFEYLIILSSFHHLRAHHIIPC